MTLILLFYIKKQKDQRKENPIHRLFLLSKRRAKNEDLEFDLTEDYIKRNLVQTIVDDSIKTKLFITQLGIIKDIYFEGISKYPEIQSKPAQYKRVMLEIPGYYPHSEDERVKFEEDTLNSIKSILEEPDLELDRLHLERVSRVKNDKGRVIVQFLIMGGARDATTANNVIMNFKNKYDNGENKYSNNYKITNVVFGDPSIILDGSDIDIPNTLPEEKALVADIDKTTLNKLEGEYRSVSYHGCELTLDDLKNNLITPATPLSLECEPNIQHYLNGFIQTKT